MRKIGKFILLFFLCVILGGTKAYADELCGDTSWQVTFTQDKKMISNFTNENIADILGLMQPGDSADFQVTIENQYQTAVDWYMTNDVIYSLEDNNVVAKGGAYRYYLTYTNAYGETKVLYDSEDVGGENALQNMEGLHEATNALKDYFYLDQLASGAKGVVRLRISLDGETQGNDYQDTLAQIKINFAVDLPVIFHDEKIAFHYEGKKKDKHISDFQDDKYSIKPYTRTIVKTGDETELTGLLIAAGILGILLLLLVIAGKKLSKKQKES